MIQLTKATALDFFAALYRGQHHIPSDLREEDGGCFSVKHYTYLASFDGDDLTRLVLLAHERCVRAWVAGIGDGCLRVWIQARDPASDRIDGTHPTIEEALAKFREADDAPWWKRLAGRATEGGFHV